MEDLQILLQYDGSWEDNSSYSNYRVSGIILPKNCNFTNLVDIISTEMKIQLKQNKLVIKYKISDDCPPISIEDDAGLTFYKELKRKDNDITKYRICVTLEKKRKRVYSSETSNATVNQDNMELVLQNNMLSMEGESSALRETSENSMNMIEYANLLSDIGETYLEEDFQEFVQGSRDIEIGKKYRDKNSLKSEISLYALSKHFQFKNVNGIYTLQRLVTQKHL
ncbi:uncharacterized protein LOC130014778 [Mercurialis annua]|uniref:uncharacterized protein LOC130014778 n=1 Tax=Mercurialis annua TaxID=3986 RepID=UPI0024AD3AA4|nr:uncharacterized protein LOC130014778 [Mercurialis annua]